MIACRQLQFKFSAHNSHIYTNPLLYPSIPFLHSPLPPPSRLWWTNCSLASLVRWLRRCSRMWRLKHKTPLSATWRRNRKALQYFLQTRTLKNRRLIQPILTLQIPPLAQMFWDPWRTASPNFGLRPQKIYPAQTCRFSSTKRVINRGAWLAARASSCLIVQRQVPFVFGLRKIFNGVVGVPENPLEGA